MDKLVSEKPDTFSDIWEGDLLECRQEEAEFLTNFLLSQAERVNSEKRGYVLNINAGWGFGKTFFMERFHRHLESSGHLVVSINAWEDDHSDDPMIAVMMEWMPLPAHFCNTEQSVAFGKRGTQP
ncbi:P-loop NTPase fold protein [Flexibacterium corallicola]|uniref:P-loop NTPase fold protein n=1 Tax=Flexibacterium corallicola TaxID=3037259 RepID=UPI00286F08AD|nr:P-loop NTPase fold protein [Pseudovibrio sp. M1P-2-3]